MYSVFHFPYSTPDLLPSNAASVAAHSQKGKGFVICEADTAKFELEHLPE
jgi:hypothetical protein